MIAPRTPTIRLRPPEWPLIRRPNRKSSQKGKLAPEIDIRSGATERTWTVPKKRGSLVGSA